MTFQLANLYCGDDPFRVKKWSIIMLIDNSFSSSVLRFVCGCLAVCLTIMAKRLDPPCLLA